jgi:hypothetical protein
MFREIYNEIRPAKCDQHKQLLATIQNWQGGKVPVNGQELSCYEKFI